MVLTVNLKGMLLKGFWEWVSLVLKKIKKTLYGNFSSLHSDAACEEVMAGAGAALLCLRSA